MGAAEESGLPKGERYRERQRVIARERSRSTEGRNTMATDPPDRSEPNKAAQPPENFDEILGKMDEELKCLDEEIQEAEKKSKAVIRDPDP
jgi:hypothetical protein